MSLVVALAGCGGSKEPSASQALTLSSATPPTAQACGFNELGSSSTSSNNGTASPPLPGTYRYATSGSLTTSGQGQTVFPRQTTAVATPSRRDGGLTCFGIEHRYAPNVDAVDVYLLRGGDIYIVAIGFNTPSDVETIRPRPAILALSATQTSWAGAFAGETTGSYSVTIVGRRPFEVGGRRVPAVGLLSRATYRGAASGTQTARTWLATDRSAMVVTEVGRSSLQYGEQLTYRSTLLSAVPAR